MSTNVNAKAEVEETNKNPIRDLTIEYENLPHMGFIAVSYTHLRAHET